LRIRRSDPAGVLGVAAEEAENVRHCESLWLFQHGRRGSAPMRVKRAAAREPFTLREKKATAWPQSVDDATGRDRWRSVESRRGRSLLYNADLVFGNRRND
jgi:hypothetical protein